MKLPAWSHFSSILLKRFLKIAGQAVYKQDEQIVSWSNSLQTGKTAYKPGEQVNAAEQVTSPALFAAYQQETQATSMYGCIHTSVGHLHVDGIARTLFGPSSEDLEVLFVDIELKALGSS